MCQIADVAAYWTDRHLRTWAYSMGAYAGPEGYRDCVVGLECYTTYDSDSELAYDKLDGWVSDQTEGVVRSLPLPQQGAICRHYGVCAVYQFPRDNYAEMLAIALAEVQAGLRRRRVWLGE